MTDKSTKRLWLFILSSLLPVQVLAASFQSVGVPKAILYDGPSIEAKKQFVVREFYPLEVIVSPAGGWAKVRDSEGGLFSIQSSKLSTLRTLSVSMDNVQLHDAPSARAKVLARVEKHVILLLNAPDPINGWLSVRTVGGKAGFVPLQTVWGY